MPSRLVNLSSVVGGGAGGICCAMAVDARQVLAGFLTMAMFVMLGNMIKRDHFDSVTVTVQETSIIQFDALKEEQKSLNQASTESIQELKPCWAKPVSKEVEQSKGYITFSLTGGPEHHISQVTDAVVIVRYLDATLVLPDIRGSELGQKRNFEDMYDADKFIASLDGVIKVARELPAELTAESPSVVKVPNRVSREYIANNVEPIFQRNSYLRLTSVFPKINLKGNGKPITDLDSTACLAMFGSLEMKREILEVAERMVERLKILSRNTGSQFIAIDLRVDVLEKKGCKEKGNGKKPCYSPLEISDFLRKVGFNADSTIYLTETWWHESLNPLKEMFPKTYTKDDLIPAEKKGQFLQPGAAELQRALDFQICSKSDVFVPAISGLFYGNVAGKRIASGRTQILVPSKVSSSSPVATDFISTYVSKKNHLAYSCFC
ncbi:hypothetical protein ZIOFF_023363 [Zingiber officinale]|uniref:O-fucosyltransferase family protein n=2 Tax=Zingiber officinale TaxID=94328 RepID=A0A8J5GZ06_ZINOF|nr:hypothetical protein ZIOFF_023363 [Zingiber officinale]